MSKRRELLIILILAVLLTILTFLRWDWGVQYKLAPGTPYYPWPLTFLAYYKWEFIIFVFARWFVGLMIGWWVLRFVWKKTKKKK